MLFIPENDCKYQKLPQLNDFNQTRLDASKKTVLTSGIKLKMGSIQTKLIPPIRMLLQKIELEVESDIVDR